jgi:hypothetical protein
MNVALVFCTGVDEYVQISTQSRIFTQLGVLNTKRTVSGRFEVCDDDGDLYSVCNVGKSVNYLKLMDLILTFRVCQWGGGGADFVRNYHASRRFCLCVSLLYAEIIVYFLNIGVIRAMRK